MRRRSKVQSIVATAVVTAGILIPTVAYPAGAFADSSATANCTVAKNGTTYTGKNWIYYYLYNADYFLLDYDAYQFGPANSSSTNNNQNIYFWGGSASDTENSPDSLKRDNVKHTDETQSNWGSITGTAGESFVQFTDIFDIPSVSDPNCKVDTAYF